MKNEIPGDIFDILPPSSTLSQGRKNVEEQFRYGVASTDDKGVTMSFASFRLSFALLIFTSVDRSAFPKNSLADKATAYQPGALQFALPRTYRN